MLNLYLLYKNLDFKEDCSWEVLLAGYVFYDVGTNVYGAGDI